MSITGFLLLRSVPQQAEVSSFSLDEKAHMCYNFVTGVRKYAGERRRNHEEDPCFCADGGARLLRCPLLTLHGDAPLEENLSEIENFLTHSCESGGNSGESSRLLRV